MSSPQRANKRRKIATIKVMLELPIELVCQSNIHSAVDLWCSTVSANRVNKYKVEKQFGEISNWDVFNVIASMSNLFKDKTDFNHDIFDRHVQCVLWC